MQVLSFIAAEYKEINFSDIKVVLACEKARYANVLYFKLLIILLLLPWQRENKKV